MYEEKGCGGVFRTGWHNIISPFTAHPPWRYSGPAGRAAGTGFVVLLAIISSYIISCATVSHHEFSEPVARWQTKSGQLMYRAPNTTLIGEVLVRFSKTGDFELTVSK